MPYPPNKGERVRAFHELKALSKQFRITLATLAHNKEDIEAAGIVRQWCENVLVARIGRKRGLMRALLAMATGKSATQGYFHSTRLETLIRKKTQRNTFSLAMGYSSSTLPYLLKVPIAHRIMDLVDVDSAKWQDYAKNAPWPKRALYQREAKAVSLLEQDAIVHCDSVFLVSHAESRLLDFCPDKAIPLANGVDTEYFAPQKKNQANPPSLVFTGTMDYRPNIEGACWFVKHVWPQLKQRFPDLSFYIVGRTPARQVRQLAETTGVYVTGSVPDVRPYLAKASIAVCPLQIARGVQNKVLEAMAMQKATIASTPALEGLDVEVPNELLQADSPDQWIQTITELLNHPDMRNTIAQKARTAVEARYSWPARMAPLVNICRQLTDSQPEPELKPKSAPHPPQTGNVPAKKWKWPSNWKEKVLWMITLAYVVFLIAVNLTPVKKNGGGWLGNISNDMQNFLHIPAYSILMILVTLAMSTSMRNRLAGILLSAFACFGFGIVMEYTQGLVPGRIVHISDMLRNGAGIMIVLPILFFWLWRPASRYDKSEKQTKNYS